MEGEEGEEDGSANDDSESDSDMSENTSDDEFYEEVKNAVFEIELDTVSH